MVLFVIVLSTMINTLNDLKQTQIIISQFKSVKEWSCDLEDEDRVLRIISIRDISNIVLSFTSPLLAFIISSIPNLFLIDGYTKEIE